MQINGLGGIDPLRRAGSRKDAASAYGAQEVGPSQTKPAGDEVQLSDASRLIAKLAQVPDVRQDKIEALRTQIQDGSYPSEEALKDGIDKMLREL